MFVLWRENVALGEKEILAEGLLRRRKCTMPSCKNWCVVGIEYCYFHLKSEKKLMVKQSMTSYTQLGLYAYDANAGPNPVFQAGTNIIQFKGDPLTDADVLDKYHRIHHDAQLAPHTYPEILKHLRDHLLTTKPSQKYNDGSFIRMVASIAQHSANPNADIVQDRRTEELILIATQDIHQNAEILVPFHNGFIPNQNSTETTSCERHQSKVTL